MKWLTAFLCMLAVPAFAEPLPPGTIQFESSMVCGQYDPILDRVYEEYGEYPFLEGDADVLSPDHTLSYQGKVRLFLNPKTGSFSMFLDLKEKFTCMITTGNFKPIIRGDES